MSGIAGIIHFDGQPVTPGQVETMTAAMPYRGPDGVNHWHRGNVALGQCMLRTTPESLEETQPLTNEDESLVLVMDGRVDNWEELRRELLAKGALLRTRADAELVLRAYEVWGRDCLPHVDGDFALVIWDARRREAFCARDRMGNRPVIYHWNGKTLSFASEVHPILALPWVPATLNETMVAEHLAADWESIEQTLWEGLLRLRPSHHIVVKLATAPFLSRYWAPDMHLTLPCNTDDEYIEYYRSVFTDVVRRMSRTHHPLAIEVSGGLDSSAIYAVADSLLRRNHLLSAQIQGYTLDLRGDANADELDYARAVGTHVGRPVREILPAHMPLEWYRDAAHRYRDLPDYPHGSMWQSIASAARSLGSRVLISGTGGDEWTSGCRLYYGEAIAGRRWSELLAITRRDAQIAGIQSAIGWLLQSGVRPLLPAGVKSAISRLKQLATGKAERIQHAWLSPRLRQRLADRLSILDEEQSRHWPRLGQRVQWRYLCSAYSALARELNERRTSRTGLEWRQPFWDRRIVQIAFATPENLRLRSENKWLHRQAMSGLLPDAVLRRSTKAEFSVAFARYWGSLPGLIETQVFAKRAEWVDASAFTRLMGQAFSRETEEWAVGIAWALFGVDAVASDSPTLSHR